MPKFPLRINNVAINLVGSVHSTSSCVAMVEQLSPTHLFVEATRDTIGLIKRNPRHSKALADLPSLVAYAEQKRIPLHGIDTTAGDLARRVFIQLKLGDKLLLVRYLLGRRVLSPVANLMFVASLSSPPGPVDRFITKWAISPSSLADARAVVARGGSEQDVARLLEARENISSFLRSVSDPIAYQQLCDRFAIDERLQSSVIDYRNDYMCNQIRRIVRSIQPGSVCAVVVGKNHVGGMEANLARGLDYSPDSLGKIEGDASFMDQILLAQLLRT